jgi:hypothetical protein
MTRLCPGMTGGELIKLKSDEESECYLDTPMEPRT